MSLDDDRRTATASQLIAKLQEFVAQHGDLPVYVRDADTGWRLPIGLIFRPDPGGYDMPPRFEIRSEYHGRPRGDILELP